MKLVFLVLSLLAVVSCGRKSGNTTRVGASGVNSGPGVIAGRLTIRSECNASSGWVFVGTSTGSTVSSQPVNNGGTFSFQMTPGSYHISAQAGGCSVSSMTNGQMIQTGYSNYQICLGQTCSTSGYKVAFSKTESAPKPLPTGLASFCEFKTWGCVNAGYTGNGESLFESNYRVVAKKATGLTFDLEYSSGNNWVFTVPALAGKGWSLEAQTDAMIKVEDIYYEHIFTRSQIQRASLQFESGFCDEGSTLAGKVADYAKLQGFSEAAAKDLAKRATTVLPAKETFCAYPQDESQIAKSLTAKASKPIELRRLWFLFSPSSATAKLKKSEASPAGKPKQDALALAKKANQSRTVANSADVMIEDLGLGFLIQP